MFVWEILDERSFSRPSGYLQNKSIVRLYARRERAEQVAHEIAARAHEGTCEEMLSYVNDEEEGEAFDDNERAWWRSRPEMTVFRTENETFYCCGDPQWDSRDRRGAAYGWVKRREVVE